MTKEQITYFLSIATWFYISFLLLIGTFALYSAIMKMREIQDRLFQLHWSVRWACYLILLVGLIFDTLLNWIFLTVTFAEFPQEFLSTARIRRHKFNSTGWRQAQALWWCKNWLTPFDEKHCE